MNVNVMSQPVPGTARAGNLYVDLQSRQLWLGVDPAVDPSGSVLISDIEYLEDAIDASVLEAKAYTDSQIITRAPTVHTHTSSQITDFNSAVTGVVAAMPGASWVYGMVALYSGLLTDIGVGKLADWWLCDGTHGTPDLREKFILAAGSRLPGPPATAPVSFVTDVQGAHSHGGGTVGAGLSVAHLPSHTHSLSVSGGGTFNTGGENVGHHHNTPFTAIGTGQGTGPGADIAAVGYGSSGYTAVSGDRSAGHFHSVGVSFTSTGTSGAAGSGAAHAHGINTDGAHAHTITSLQLRDNLPWYALAYIMYTKA